MLVDLVPKHLCVTDSGNRWWNDVLAHGRASGRAGTFDIDWEAGGGKVVLPILGEPLGRLLESGGLRAVYREGGFALVAGDPGTGKSVALRLLAERLGQQSELVVGANPFDLSQTMKIKRTEVESVTPSPESPMPPGLIDRLEQGIRVLDLGCGNGLYLLGSALRRPACPAPNRCSPP